LLGKCRVLHKFPHLLMGIFLRKRKIRFHYFSDFRNLELFCRTTKRKPI
jgi:hypothetical protein